MMLMLRKTMKKEQKDENSTGSHFAGVLVYPKNIVTGAEQSPTSHIGIFSSNAFRRPRSEREGKYQKRWECGKVGLSLVYALDDDDDDDDDETVANGNIVQSPCLKIVPAVVDQGPEPADVGGEGSKVIFEIGDSLFVPDMRPLHIGTVFLGPIVPAEMELSEDYTRVIAHGPIPKVTHIFGDYIFGKEHGFSTEFLKHCYACQKTLDGEDIYMYRGEKAFCSNVCRAKEIEVDEATGKYNDEEVEKNNDGGEIEECISETSDD